jgi:23S rRNA (uracil1939-C5)-methyltransferase
VKSRASIQRPPGPQATASCSHRPPCPGCPRFGEPGIAPEAYAALEALARAHGLASPVVVVDGALAGFRLRSRLALRGRPGTPKVGMFELGSHRLVHIPNCVVHHPLINHVASVVRRALVDTGASTYSETRHSGLARYLQVVVERRTQTAQVVLVGNTPTPEPLAPCLDLIRDRLGADLHSLWFNAQCERTNAILGREFHHWHGPASVVENFGGADVHYPPGAFGQNNLDIAERIVEYLREQVPSGSDVTEFYAGVGAIGLSLLPRVARLRMNEVSPASLQGLELGMAGLSPTERAKIEVVPGAAGDACAMAAGAQVVIADPPRKGLDRALVEQLVTQPPERMLYVSCGWESFVEDAARLTSTGTLRLAELRAFNLMPFTGHVETVARFERCAPVSMLP